MEQEEKGSGFIENVDVDLSNLWVVQFSPSQRGFHVSVVPDVIAENHQAMLSEYSRVTDYITVGFAGTHDDALRVIARCKRMLPAGTI